MRIAAALLLVAAASAADDATRYFEVGLDYLSKGLYEEAGDAFAESLVRAPGEPVPTAFLGIAIAADGRHPSAAALILRTAYRRLGDKQTLRLDLNKLLPSGKAVAQLRLDFERRLRATEGRLRRDILGVLAFLEVHDGTPKSAPSLDALLKEHPQSAYGLALRKLQTEPKKPVQP